MSITNLLATMYIISGKKDKNKGYKEFILFSSLLNIPNNIHWHVVKHGMESGVYFGVESGVTFGVIFGVNLEWVFFFLFFSKMHFVSFAKIVIIIFCLLKVLFDGLTTLKSMAEVNKQKF